MKRVGYSEVYAESFVGGVRCVEKTVVVVGVVVVVVVVVVGVGVVVVVVGVVTAGCDRQDNDDRDGGSLPRASVVWCGLGVVLGWCWCGWWGSAWSVKGAVSYTYLTLPTIYAV